MIRRPSILEVLAYLCRLEPDLAGHRAATLVNGIRSGHPYLHDLAARKLDELEHQVAATITPEPWHGIETSLTAVAGVSHG